MKSIPIIKIGDVLELKKPHPCGSGQFKVLRVGSDLKITCCGCDRVMTLERVKVEKMIKNIISSGDDNE